eukprot:CAMPEP_0196822864 /NCGR_PEP_ID=MMETSP1362-20130617/85075_1 /TAXON_ID=163516 /ORGANISM="Leptocylindrus danicus, Strain CCMP1856" /LENGTH=436 /DNA_ID=CAMNT_0042202541 /DNA_START=326 /DNA_END=1636 /DNA_ORIENTATION=+
MILAPLTRGGNLPFRRLCADFGMEVSLGEMVYARSLIKNDRIEQARLRRAPNEKFFGVQIATNQIDEGTKAIAMAAEAGADFVDLNCGCPIYEATRRGLGSSLLRSPKKLGKLVAGMVAESSKTNGGIPISVKIRLGCEASSINVNEVVQSVCDAGASAVTIHGRTAQQGYSKAADWDLIRDVTNEIATTNSGVPIIGNGDILTHFEANRRIESYGVDAVMVGRGALTKPWIFQEFNSKQTWNPSLDDRIAVYRNLALHMKDHFGDDDMGRKKSWYFLPWHFEFLSRYMYHPEEDFATVSVDQPLIQSRSSIPTDASPLQILLSHRSKDAHDLIADALWCSDSSEDAVSKLCVVSESHAFLEILKKCNESENDGDSTTELSNIPSSSKRSGGRWHKRRGRDPKPQRTPEEIAIIRAERAAKKAASLEAEAQDMPQI